MASPTFAPQPNSCAITIGVFDGSRQPLGGGHQVLFTVRDGNQRQVYREFQQTSSLMLKDLPFFDNFGDDYTIIVTADGFEMGAWRPVTVSNRAPVTMDILLMPNKGALHFVYSTEVALSDGILPKSSGDGDIPRFTWWDHKGTEEWVQYDYDQPRKIGGRHVVH